MAEKSLVNDVALIEMLDVPLVVGVLDDGFDDEPHAASPTTVPIAMPACAARLSETFMGAPLVGAQLRSETRLFGR